MRGPLELFEQVVVIEDKDRARRGLKRRLKRSRLEHFKPMADYDWNWPTKIDRPLVEFVVRLDFLDEPRNVSSPPPKGWADHDRPNVAQQAVLRGHGVLFISASPPPNSCSISAHKSLLEP